MRVVIPQIAWHARDPVLTLDFDPKGKSEQGYYRLATGGADRLLLIWHLSNPTYLKPDIIPVAELTRHQKGINVVRFSPCGNYIASGDDDSYVFIWKCESVTEKEEVWNVEKIFRRHVEDVSDLSWSPDSNFIVSGSVDNTAVLWDVKKGTPIHFWSEREHTGFVQGVVYDPLGEFSATMCIDRNLRFFNNKNGKLMVKALKYPPAWYKEEEEKENSPGPSQSEEQVQKEKQNITATEISPVKRDNLPQTESGVENSDIDSVTPNVSLPSSATSGEEAAKTISQQDEPENPSGVTSVSEVSEKDSNKASEQPATEVLEDQNAEDSRDKPLSEINGEDQLPLLKLPPKRPMITLNRMFHDDSLKTFCRRLGISPRGELLIVPGGLLPPVEKDEKKDLGEPSSRQSSPPPVDGVEDAAVNTISDDQKENKENVPVEEITEEIKEEAKRPNEDEIREQVDDKEHGESKVAEEGGEVIQEEGSEKVDDETKEKEKTSKRFDQDQNNAAILFCRNSWTNPCAVIPTGVSYSIAAKFNPIYFQRERQPYDYEADFQNSNKRNERVISCVGKLRPQEFEHPVLLDMPYRLVYAVATNDCLLIGDTLSAEPLACVQNIHCTRMTDISWSPDGLVLIASSTDGFCSILTFDEGELGQEFKLETGEEFPALTLTSFPIAPPEPKPAKKPKEPKEPKEKEPKEVKEPKEQKEKKEKKEKTDKEAEPVTPVDTKEKKKKEPLMTIKKMFSSVASSPRTPTTPTVEKVQAVEAATASPVAEPSPVPAPAEVTTPKPTFLDGWVKKTPKSSSSEVKQPRRIQLTTLSNSNKAASEQQVASSPSDQTQASGSTGINTASLDSPVSTLVKQPKVIEVVDLEVAEDEKSKTTSKALDVNVACVDSPKSASIKPPKRIAPTPVRVDEKPSTGSTNKDANKAVESPTPTTKPPRRVALTPVGPNGEPLTKPGACRSEFTLVADNSPRRIKPLPVDQDGKPKTLGGAMNSTEGSISSPKTVSTKQPRRVELVRVDEDGEPKPKRRAIEIENSVESKPVDN